MLAELGPGEVGFFTAAIKEVADTRVGDTVTDEKNPTPEALPGFKPAQPVVFCGLFPVDAADFEDLRDAMAKLRLNDASFSFETETLGGARPRLPLRLPRPPASRDHHRAARARVRPRPHHHGAVGHLSSAPDRRLDDRDAQPGRHAGHGAHRSHRGAVDRGDDPGAGRVSRRGPEAVPGPARAAEGAHLRRQRAPCSSTSCRSTRWCSTSTTA